MADTLATYQSDGNIVTITLNRAEKRNALSRELIEQLRSAFEKAKNDEQARCVILTGAGTVFCAGMDLAELKSSLEEESDEGPIWEDALRLSNLYDLIYRLPKPTIAAVNGAAVAGGAGMVSVCDLAVSSSDAKFGYPEVKRGLVAAMVMPHLMRHVGDRMARYLLLTGDLISADEAKQFGLINEVVSADQVMEQAKKWAASLIEGGPHAIARTKELITEYSHHASSIEESARASASPRLTEECQQGLRAFFDKKPAPWVSQ